MNMRIHGDIYTALGIFKYLSEECNKQCPRDYSWSIADTGQSILTTINFKNRHDEETLATLLVLKFDKRSYDAG